MHEFKQVDSALSRLVAEVESFGESSPGEFRLEYTGGVHAPATPWLCVVEVDVPGGEFSVWGNDPGDVLFQAVERLHVLKPAEGA
jgi:hypothetical protein